MKIKIYLTCCILLLSCSSSKIEKNVLRDFLEDQLKKSPDIKVVMKEPLESLVSLEYYEKAYQDRNIRLGDMIRVRPETNPPFVWQIDSLEIIKLKEKYKNDTIKQLWRKSDFQESKLKLTTAKMIKNIKSHLSERYLGYEGIEISKPLITSEEKFVLLFFKTFTLDKYSTHPMEKAVLMEKINGKWMIKETYSDFGIIN
jgi:hypothetical protein